jgi:hypothetical protein
MLSLSRRYALQVCPDNERREDWMATSTAVLFVRHRARTFSQPPRGLPLTLFTRFHVVDWSDFMARKDNSNSREAGPGALLRPDQIAEDAPLRLNVAATIAYPDGSMTASGLRREAARGRLAVERTAGKDYTTLGAIRKMRDLCRLEAKGRDSGYGERDANERRETRTTPCGSSETENIKRAQAAARMIVQELKGHSRNTLTESTWSKRPKERVIRLKSR